MVHVSVIVLTVDLLSDRPEPFGIVQIVEHVRQATDAVMSRRYSREVVRSGVRCCWTMVTIGPSRNDS